MKLYEIDEAYQAWQEKVMEAEGEVTPELMEELNQIQENGDEKLESYAIVVKSLLSDSAAINAEKKRLEEREKRAKLAAERVKGYADHLMHLLGKDTFKTARAAITYRKSESINITDETAIPEQYFRVKREVSKTDIKAALKNGEAIDGVELVENQNIQIR